MVQLQDIISAYFIKEVLRYAIIILSSSLFVLFLILIIDKLTTEKRETRKRKYRDRYLAFISSSLGGIEAEVKRPQSKLEYEALTDVCIDLLLSISGDIAERVKAILKDMQLVDYYKKIGASRFWSRRYYAVEKLGFLNVDELKQYFLDLINIETHEEVKGKAIWALSLIADEEVLRIMTNELLKETPKSAKFNEYIYTNVILSFRRKDIVDRFISYLEEIKLDDEIPALLKRDLIEACGSSFLHEAADTIVTYFSMDDENPEMKIACIRALGKMGGSQACKLIASGFTSDDWRVRTVSANAAHLCDETVIPYLQQLLYDRVYFVRINASRALAKFGKKGLSVLESEVDSQDRFVRDTARFILEDNKRHA